MTTIRCTRCHGSNVQVKAWIRPNHDDSVVSDFVGEMLNEINDCYCEDCEENTRLDSFEDENLLEEANRWWEAIDSVTIEPITKLIKSYYPCENDSQTLLNSYHQWWDEKSDNDKIKLRKKHKEE